MVAIHHLNHTRFSHIQDSVIFVDYYNNGVIEDADKTKIGKGMPDWTFGLTLNAEWKGFDLNLFFQGTAGNDVFDFSQRGDIPAMNRPTWILDRWIGEGTSNKIPRMTSSNPNSNWRSSDLYICMRLGDNIFEDDFSDLFP